MAVKPSERSCAPCSFSLPGCKISSGPPLRSCSSLKWYYSNSTKTSENLSSRSESGSESENLNIKLANVKEMTNLKLEQNG